MMQESKGNMYPGVETWNPLAGECKHECSYCSTNSLMRYPIIKTKYSGGLRLDYKTLSKSLGNKNKIIFVVAQNDLFAKEVPDYWIEEVFLRCKRFDNTYLFQTKNPRRFIEFYDKFPSKTILCTTIETNRSYPQMGKAPSVFERSLAMAFLPEFHKQITIEPIMRFDLEEMVVLIKQCNVESVSIGADSKRNNLPEPSKEKILALIDELQKFTVIDQKRNLKRLLL